MSGPSTEYLAGFFDGEGYVGLGRLKRSNRPNVYYNVVVVVAQTDDRVLRAIKREYGGAVHRSHRAGTRGYRHDLFRWHASGPTACAFLRDIHPRLIIKAEQVRIALGFQALLRGERMHAGEDAWLAIKQLNKGPRVGSDSLLLQ